MAAAQQSRNVGQFNDEEKAKFSEIANEAKALLANNAKGNQHHLAMVFGGMKNEPGQPLKLYAKHSYQGEFLVDPPEHVPGHRSTNTFGNRGAVSEGNVGLHLGPKAAVIYGDYDNIPNQLGWLLAYYMPDNYREPKRVYVEAGPLDKIRSMGWEEIEKKLDASSDRSFFVDSKTGAAADAGILDQGNKLAIFGGNINRDPNQPL